MTLQTARRPSFNGLNPKQLCKGALTDCYTKVGLGVKPVPHTKSLIKPLFREGKHHIPATLVLIVHTACSTQ